MTNIGREAHDLRLARTRAIAGFMKQYDAEVYEPAMKALRLRCKSQGHVFGSSGSNGFGTSWSVCARCGARFDIVGIDGERMAND